LWKGRGGGTLVHPVGFETGSPPARWDEKKKKKKKKKKRKCVKKQGPGPRWNLEGPAVGKKRGLPLLFVETKKLTPTSAAFGGFFRRDLGQPSAGPATIHKAAYVRPKRGARGAGIFISGGGRKRLFCGVRATGPRGSVPSRSRPVPGSSGPGASKKTGGRPAAGAGAWAARGGTQKNIAWVRGTTGGTRIRCFRDFRGWSRARKGPIPGGGGDGR